MEKKRKRFKPQGRLDTLSDSLYSRKEEIKEPVINTKTPEMRPEAEPRSFSVPRDWGQEVTQEESPAENHKLFKINGTAMKWLNKILLFSLLFFVISVVVATSIFLRGGNQVSTSNVVIEVAGPASVGAGETLTYDLSFTNGNNVDLEAVNILIEYPRGTRSVDGSRELLRESQFVGDIASGDFVNIHRQAVLFGEANDVQDILVSIEYRVKDSSATYFKERKYAVAISTSPVSLAVSSFNEIIAGQEFEFTAEVVSNSPTIINDMLLRVDYPVGFEFVSASPGASFGNNLFIIGDLQPSEKRIFRIKGRLSGQENEEKNFSFNLGTADRANDKLLGTVFAISDKTILVNRPFMSLSLLLNGNSDNNYPTEAGKRISGSIVWTNNLPTRITDLEITAKLTGQLDRTTVSSGSGFYRSVDDTIIWDKTTSSRLAVISPSESGSVDFSFGSLPTNALVYGSARGNTVSIEISLKARRLSDANVPEEIISSVTRTVKLESDIGFKGRSLYFTGPFSNQGPIPPVADRNTTYTVIWSLTNTLNNISGVTARAVLPTYATFVGTVSPSSESVVYNPQSNEVIWNIGDLAASTGFSAPARDVAFQISVVPSLSQIGKSPAILGPASVTGTDRFTQNTIRESVKEVTTLIEDAFMHSGEATKVVTP